MPIFHRDCATTAEATVMAGAIEATGGTVISIAQDQAGRWQIWSRIGASADPNEIDRHYSAAVARLESAKTTAPAKRVPPRRRLKSDF